MSVFKSMLVKTNDDESIALFINTMTSAAHDLRPHCLLLCLRCYASAAMPPLLRLLCYASEASWHACGCLRGGVIDCQVSSHLPLATCSPHSPLNIAGLLTLDTCLPQLSRQTLCLARQCLGGALASEFEANLRARRCRFEVAVHLFPAPLYYTSRWGGLGSLHTPPAPQSTCHELVKFPSIQVSFYASCLSASTNTHTHTRLLQISLCYTVLLQVVKFADARHGFTRPEKTREADAAAGQAFKYPHTLPSTSHLPQLSPTYMHIPPQSI